MPRTRRVSTRELRRMAADRLEGGIGGEGVDLAMEELARRESRSGAIWPPIWAALAGATATALIELFFGVIN